MAYLRTILLCLLRPLWFSGGDPGTNLEHGKAVSKGERGSSGTLHALSLPVRARGQLTRCEESDAPNSPWDLRRVEGGA